MNNNALNLHKKLHGKLIIFSKLPLKNKKNLTLTYTPGVAEAVNYIHNNGKSIYDLTIKNNSVAVITDGSAVLGLGNVGPNAALPVMEGKCAIFTEFSSINAFPICLATQDTDEIVETIKNIAPVFGGINLEDISAPRCFEIEEKLQKILDIPVMHDDQHATAIVVLAGLMNACKIVKKNLKSCKIVINGAGSAGSAITQLLHFYGVKNIILLDSEGILSTTRQHLHNYKKSLIKITNPQKIDGNLKEAIERADILIGVSDKNLFTKNIIAQMNNNPIVFALANPDPELTQKDAKKWGVTVYANGRSDCINQINNALVFPGFFKGLLKYRIRSISQKMKINSAIVIASLVKKPTSFNFIPSILDKRLVPAISESLGK